MRLRAANRLPLAHEPQGPHVDDSLARLREGAQDGAVRAHRQLDAADLEALVRGFGNVR